MTPGSESSILIRIIWIRKTAYVQKRNQHKVIEMVWPLVLWIRNPVLFYPWIWLEKSLSGIRYPEPFWIRDEQPGSYFLELKTIFWVNT
jgi:hypothetical protein